MFFDAHSHIQLKKEFPDVSAVIENAERAGVKAQLIIGYNMLTSREAMTFVREHEQGESSGSKFWCAIGIHPHDAIEATEENLLKLEEMILSEKRVVAIGEIGLDYFRNLSPKEVQKDAFRGQLRLAKKLDLPVILHVRDAQEDVLNILEEEGNTKVVMHSFSGNLADARVCFERGYYLSFSGPLTYPKNDELRQVAALVPPDKVLVETDCPYLPPQKYRGQRNEPAYVVEVVKEFAAINKMSISEVEKRLEKNFETCFGVRL